MRLAGHKLTMEWNGERARGESATTGTCPCGWSESCSSREEVRHEYRCHLRQARERAERVLAEMRESD